MIDIDEPDGWRAFQDWVSKTLRETGVVTEVEKEIDTARGVVVVDVWAHDPSGVPPQTYIIECKQWRSRVPKTIVHAFRSVVGDSGAHWGAVVSAKGFQRGAYQAARYSNVRLLTWLEFQELFEGRWFERYFLPTLTENTDALIEYTEPINTRISRKADALPADRLEQFWRLREKYLNLSAVVILCQAPAFRLLEDVEVRNRLPLRSHVKGLIESGSKLPDSILDAPSLRSILEAILDEAAVAIAEFDTVFGGRA
jgi:restriction system protein